MINRTAVTFFLAAAYSTIWVAGQTPAPAFEVASIKQAIFGDGPAYFQGFLEATGGSTCGASAIRIAGNRATVTKITPCSLIRLSYDIHDYQVAGMPDWMTKPDKSIYYDIDARAEEGTALTQERAREMLRTLLADRFKLKIHHELREAPVYALMVGKNGPKFPANGEKFVDGLGKKPCTDPSFRGSFGGSGIGGSKYTASCGPDASGTMAGLAQHITNETDRAVIDKTGLTGHYAYMLHWTAEGRTPAPDAPPSIFTAIQDQLGLKLDPQGAS